MLPEVPVPVQSALVLPTHDAIEKPPATASVGVDGIEVAVGIARVENPAAQPAEKAVAEGTVHLVAAAQLRSTAPKKANERERTVFIQRNRCQLSSTGQ